MSAFLCSYAHINAMLHFLRRDHTHGTHGCTELRVGSTLIGAWTADETWQAAARILYNENCRSMKARYQGRAEEANQPFDTTRAIVPFFVKRLTAIEAIKACQCYNYQACETDDYESSDAYSIIKRIIACAHNELPGYEEAPWGYDDARFDPSQTPTKVAPAPIIPIAPALEAAHGRIKFSILERADKSTKSPHALAASNIKKTLKHIWPDVKFEVRSESFSMGNAVRIHWVDGPSGRDVDDIVNQWSAGSFNGMDDSYEYTRTIVNETYGKVTFVTTSRKVSPDKRLQVARDLGFTQASLDGYGALNTGDIESDRAVTREINNRDFCAVMAK